LCTSREAAPRSILRDLGDGRSDEEIVQALPGLTVEDVRAAACAADAWPSGSLQTSL
jgi:uncharacterized protein (DUF433 family)